MPIQNWSDDIRVVEIGDDPQFTDELNNLMDELEKKSSHVVLNFAAVGFVNSSNVARLLRLRKTMLSTRKRLMLCDVVVESRLSLDAVGHVDASALTCD